MQVSAHWLKDYAKTNASVHDIAERLTMGLNEVDEIRSLNGLSKIVVGEVTELNRHKNADKLWIATVTAGRAAYQIVTGADNLFVGAKAPLAKVGITLPDGLKITRRTFRGERSEGMLCSPRELGAGDDHSGIWLLPSDVPSGQPLDKALAGRRDTFDLEVPANRPDCMGHLGIAREVSQLFGAKLKEPALNTANRPKPGAYSAKSTDPKQCARFTLARIRGLKNGESPEWLKERLVSVGLRPISAVVDITNFVMLETGQPLHAYDVPKLTGVMIYARPSRKEESIKTLDGKTRKLPKGTLVISDRTQTLGIAGIMGGASSEVTKKSDDIILECANFDSASIRRSSRALGLRTDASARFEKGLPAELTWPAIRRAIDLLLEICGGELVQLTDDYSRRQKVPTLKLDADQLQHFLGAPLTLPSVKKSLSTLGFAVKGSAKRLSVTPPYWRPDVQDEADLYEEAARLTGYDKLPSSMPSGQLAVPSRPPLHALQQSIRSSLVGFGCTEILTHSLVGRSLLERTGFPTNLVAMTNPLSEDHEFLRGSMGPRHLEAVADNLRWRDSLQLFELGTVFEPTSGKRTAPKEQAKLLVTLASKQTKDTFSEIRGILTGLVANSHLAAEELTFTQVDIDKFVSGRHFQIFHKRTKVGWVGEYRSPKRFKAGRIYMLSLNLEKYGSVLPESWSVQNPPTHPPALRDLSWFMPETVSYADVRKLISDNGQSLVRWIGDPEEYRADGKRSLKVRLALGSPDRTLKDTEVNQVIDSIVSAANGHGWKIR